jgi:rod shape-determining protein MreD
LARILFGLAVGFAALSLQPALELWVPFGASPDLVLVWMCVYAVRLGGTQGIALGFAAGTLEGAVVGKSIGAFCASRTLAGWFAVWAGRYLPREGVWSAGLISWGATWVAEGAFLLVSPRVGFSRWIATAGAISLANGVAAMPLAWLVDRVERVTSRGRKMGLGPLRAR